MGNKVNINTNNTCYTPTKQKKSLDILGIFGRESFEKPKTRSATKSTRDCLYAEDKIFENYDST
jgi:hypothetical protein